ncbi:MAG: hypothetical protein WC533_00425 [Candidatus Pacearchaeota archaeon]
MKKVKNKKGQVTIFIIIAVLIIVAVIFLFILYKNGKLPISPKPSQEPNQEVMQCVREAVEDASNMIIDNGGYVKLPNEVKKFENKEYPYLCYTSKNNAKCQPVNPVLINHIEDEIYDYSLPKAQKCFNDIKAKYEKEGYEVVLEKDMDYEVVLLSGKIEININREFKISKADDKKGFSKYEIQIPSPIYNIAVVVHTIIEQEAKYCNSDYPLIMRANTWANIEKFQTGDDNKIYTVKDTRTNKLWGFAVRGCVLETP